MAFVHLHTHSEYSLLDGANRIGDLVAHTQRLGMDSLAVTDHGNLHAAWTFYETARAARLRPIPLPPLSRFTRAWARLPLDVIHDPDGRPAPVRRADGY